MQEVVRISRPPKPGAKWIVRDINSSRVQRLDDPPQFVHQAMRDVKVAYFMATFISLHSGWSISHTVVAGEDW